MITALRALAAPYGAAVRLILTSPNVTGLHALILATPTAAVPSPTLRDGARVVHAGPFRELAGVYGQSTEGAGYQAMDLSTPDLPDEVAVYYHAFEMLEDGSYGPHLTVSATPNCVRQATVNLVRDIVRERLKYHLTRGVRDGALPPELRKVPLLEQEVLVQGFNLPAVLLKEAVSPNPSAETVGKGPEDWTDATPHSAYREYTHATNARIDLLVLTGDPEVRSVLEKYLHGVLLQDVDFYQAAGLEGIDVQRSIRHDVDPAGTNYYNVELTLSATAYIRVREELTYAVTDNRAYTRNG